MSTDFYMILINRGLYDLGMEGRDTKYSNEPPSEYMYEVLPRCNKYRGKTFDRNRYSLTTDYDNTPTIYGDGNIEDRSINEAYYVYIRFRLCDLSLGNEDSNELIYSLYERLIMKNFIGLLFLTISLLIQKKLSLLKVVVMRVTNVENMNIVLKKLY